MISQDRTSRVAYQTSGRIQCDPRPQPLREVRQLRFERPTTFGRPRWWFDESPLAFTMSGILSLVLAGCTVYLANRVAGPNRLLASVSLQPVRPSDQSAGSPPSPSEPVFNLRPMNRAGAVPIQDHASIKLPDRSQHGSQPKSEADSSKRSRTESTARTSAAALRPAVESARETSGLEARNSNNGTTPASDAANADKTRSDSGNHGQTNHLSADGPPAGKRRPTISIPPPPPDQEPRKPESENQIDRTGTPEDIATAPTTPAGGTVAVPAGNAPRMSSGSGTSADSIPRSPANLARGEGAAGTDPNSTRGRLARWVIAFPRLQQTEYEVMLDRFAIELAYKLPDGQSIQRLGKVSTTGEPATADVAQEELMVWFWLAGNWVKEFDEAILRQHGFSPNGEVFHICPKALEEDLGRIEKGYLQARYKIADLRRVYQTYFRIRPGGTGGWHFEVSRMKLVQEMDEPQQTAAESRVLP